MKEIFLIIALATSSYYFYTTSGTTRDDYIDITKTYTQEPIQTQNLNKSNIDYLTDIEYYILESLKRTNYTFYVIGGWVRDRVYNLKFSY